MYVCDLNQDSTLFIYLARIYRSFAAPWQVNSSCSRRRPLAGGIRYASRSLISITCCCMTNSKWRGTFSLRRCCSCASCSTVAWMRMPGECCTSRRTARETSARHQAITCITVHSSGDCWICVCSASSNCRRQSRRIGSVIRRNWSAHWTIWCCVRGIIIAAGARPNCCTPPPSCVAAIRSSGCG